MHVEMHLSMVKDYKDGQSYLVFRDFPLYSESSKTLHKKKSARYFHVLSKESNQKNIHLHNYYRISGVLLCRWQ